MYILCSLLYAFAQFINIYTNYTVARNSLSTHFYDNFDGFSFDDVLFLSQKCFIRRLFFYLSFFFSSREREKRHLVIGFRVISFGKCD